MRDFAAWNTSSAFECGSPACPVPVKSPRSSSKGVVGLETVSKCSVFFPLYNKSGGYGDEYVGRDEDSNPLSNELHLCGSGWLSSVLIKVVVLSIDCKSRRFQF